MSCFFGNKDTERISLTALPVGHPSSRAWPVWVISGGVSQSEEGEATIGTRGGHAEAGAPEGSEGTAGCPTSECLHTAQGQDEQTLEYLSNITSSENAQVPPTPGKLANC